MLIIEQTGRITLNGKPTHLQLNQVRGKKILSDKNKLISLGDVTHMDSIELTTFVGMKLGLH